MSASAPSSSLKPFEWPPKFCTNCQRRKVNGMLNSRFSRTKSLSRRALHCEVAVKKRFLREGEHARELLFLRHVLRRRRALPPPPPCSLLEAQLALHVAEEQDANARLVRLKPQFLHHHSAPRTLHPKFWCFLIALERSSAALVVLRQHHPYH